MGEPPERPVNGPWCAAESLCACFGTVAPSTALRDPQSPLKPRCVHFRPDGGKTKTLRELR